MPRSNLLLDEVCALIARDWSVEDGKGYYINGKLLSTSLYRPDCVFIGPDPDMPVHGLRKYLLVASSLFDVRRSRADLLHPLVVNESKNQIVAHWRIEGVLRLPWKPHVKPWTGRTIYHLDANNYIMEHEEFWDISAFDAFISVVFPHWPFGALPAPSIDHIRDADKL